MVFVPTTGKRQVGTIQKWFPEKNYGWAKDDRGEQFFVSGRDFRGLRTDKAELRLIYFWPGLRYAQSAIQNECREGVRISLLPVSSDDPWRRRWASEWTLANWETGLMETLAVLREMRENDERCLREREEKVRQQRAAAAKREEERLFVFNHHDQISHAMAKVMEACMFG